MTNDSLSTVSIGAPITRSGVSFFPLYLPGNDLPDIVTGDAAGLKVKELGEASVPKLEVFNPTRKPVLVVEGEHWIGGKQNRTVSTTVLVPPRKKLEIPVACLERGRWGRERAYAPSPAFAPRRVRRRNQEGVQLSMALRGTRQGDQGAVWQEVDEHLRAHSVASATAAAADVRWNDKRREGDAAELIGRGPLPGQTGIAVGYGEHIVAVELFGAAHLLQAHWEGLVRSHLSHDSDESGTASATEALRVVREFAFADGHEAPGVGMGTERRVKAGESVGQALLLDRMLVHASIFVRPKSGADAYGRRPFRRGLALAS